MTEPEADALSGEPEAQCSSRDILNAWGMTRIGDHEYKPFWNEPWRDLPSNERRLLTQIAAAEAHRRNAALAPSDPVEPEALQNALYGMTMTRLHGEDAERLIREVIGAAPVKGEPVAWQYKMRRWADCSKEAYGEYLQDGTLVRKLDTHPPEGEGAREALERIASLLQSGPYSSYSEWARRVNEARDMALAALAAQAPAQTPEENDGN